VEVVFNFFKDIFIFSFSTFNEGALGQGSTASLGNQNNEVDK